MTWHPGERLTYYPSDDELCDDRGNVIAHTCGDAFGRFAETASQLSEWLDHNPDVFGQMVERIGDQRVDELFRLLCRLRGMTMAPVRTR